jgi:hypothetical protein
MCFPLHPAPYQNNKRFLKTFFRCMRNLPSSIPAISVNIISIKAFRPIIVRFLKVIIHKLSYAVQFSCVACELYILCACGPAC